MTGLRDRFAGTDNDTITAQIAKNRRWRVWKVVIVSNVVALIAAIAGCMFMMRTQGVHADVAQMRDEVGETLTMMSLGGASEAVTRYLPSLIDTTVRWNRKFTEKRESFRGMDVEIDQVIAMNRLGAMAERWRTDLESVSPMQRNEIWQKSLKAQVEGEQKKWPNLTHKKGAAEWLQDMWMEFWSGMKDGLEWPYGICSRTAEIVGVDRIGIGDRIHYILFPYSSLSAFTMLRLAGIALVTSGLGYFMCWFGLKSRFGWLSYVGLIYFLYLINVAIFIVCLEVTR